MEAIEMATVIEEGECQMVVLPKGFRLPTARVSIRHSGQAIILEPVKGSAWPEGFFESIEITDPAFERMDQGAMPPTIAL